MESPDSSVLGSNQQAWYHYHRMPEICWDIYIHKKRIQNMNLKQLIHENAQKNVNNFHNSEFRKKFSVVFQQHLIVFWIC